MIYTIQNKAKIAFTALCGIVFILTAVFAAATPSVALAGGYGYGYGNNYGNNYGSNNHGGHYDADDFPPYYITAPTPQIPVYVPQQPVYQPAPVYYNPQYPTYPNNYYQNNYNNVPYNYNYQNSYSPLSVTCSANTSYATVGTTVYWNANVSGGSGSYTYQWGGSDQVYGSNSSLGASYNTPGPKYASLTVYSNGQTITQGCTNSVNVTGGYVTQQYNNNQQYTNTTNTNYQNTTNSGGLIVACAADARNVNVGTPVTWSVESTGGNGQYSYSWTGSDGLTGSQTSIATSYTSTGSKTASVTVTSGGATATAACGSAVNVVPAGQSVNNTLGRTNSSTGIARGTSTNGLTANALFSLANIPWGWVALLIILVLAATVLYLLFNKSKI